MQPLLSARNRALEGMVEACYKVASAIRRALFDAPAFDGTED